MKEVRETDVVAEDRDLSYVHPIRKIHASDSAKLLANEIGSVMVVGGDADANYHRPAMTSNLAFSRSFVYTLLPYNELTALQTVELYN